MISSLWQNIIWRNGGLICWLWWRDRDFHYYSYHHCLFYPCLYEWCYGYQLYFSFVWCNACFGICRYIEEAGSDELKDYKIMCFNGKVKCSFVFSERFSEDGLKVTFFDRDWNVMPFERHYPKSKIPIDKPLNYNKMIELAEVLSKDIPFVRVDFYEVSGKVYFGELTFFPGSGFEEFEPFEWDRTLGSWIELPEKQ